jgi:hypothetical protein
MRALALAVLVALPALAACSTPCEDLAAKICGCEASTALRDACERRASDLQDQRGTSDAEQNRCDKLVDTCDCHALDTAAGKRACGLAE